MASYPLSPTAISSFVRCPREYYYKYITRTPYPPTEAMFLGRLVHSVIHAYVDEQPADPDAWLLDAIVRQAEVEWELVCIANDDEEPEDINPEERVNRAFFLLKETKALEAVDALGLQAHHAEVTLQNDHFQARADYVDPDRGRIIEIKTASRKWAEDRFVFWLQRKMYSVLWREAHGAYPEIVVYVLIDKNRPELQARTLPAYNEQKGESVRRELEEIKQAINIAEETGVYPRTGAVASFMSPCHRCPYFDICE